jgi:hypothetical protein
MGYVRVGMSPVNAPIEGWALAAIVGIEVLGVVLGLVRYRALRRARAPGAARRAWRPVVGNLVLATGMVLSLLMLQLYLTGQIRLFWFLAACCVNVICLWIYMVAD